jgi:M6 family metalloprotease-like protein
MKHLIQITSIIILLLFTGCKTQSSDDSFTDISSTTDTLSNQEDNNQLPDNTKNDNTPVANLATISHHQNQIPTVIILLEYDNENIKYSQNEWSNKIFGYNDKELNDYYNEVSREKFYLSKAQETYDVENDGIIKVHLNKNHINKSINDDGFSNALTKDLISAINKADRYIDFSLYDANSDGAIQPYELNIVFVMAGYEDAYEGYHVTNGIWAHQSSINSTDAPIADGVRLFDSSYNGKYAIFGETHDKDDPHMATIGIIAHELGHAIFDLPDLYNTVGTKGGIGAFGLMGAGIWGKKENNENPGDTPVHFCAWSKTYIGWVTPKELNNTSTTLTQSASKDYDVIKIPISANYYYLLENRNNSGYDRGLKKMIGDEFEGGIAIWLINQNKLTTSDFETNTVNSDVNNKGVDLIEAVNPILDIYPYSSGSYKALFYNPNKTYFTDKITDISSPGDVMNLNIH